MSGRANGNYKHGLYSAHNMDGVNAKIEEYLKSNPDDLTSELALVRALLNEYLSKLTRPSQDALSGVTALVEQIRKIVDTISKVRANTTLTSREIQLVMQGMSAVLQKYVPPERLPDAVEDLRRAVQHS